MTSSPDTPPPLSVAALREVDRRAEADFGIPGVVLMENAARGAVEVARREVPRGRGPVWILCGPGNNGGDGYAMARWFRIHGWDARLASFRAARDARGDAAVMRAVCERAGVPETLVLSETGVDALAPHLADADLVVDALLGTGFEGEVREPLASAFEAVGAARSAGARVLAVDLPSGFHADAGTTSRAVVRADLTVTFVAPKTGFAVVGSSELTGAVHVAPIGVPPELVDAVRREGL